MKVVHPHLPTPGMSGMQDSRVASSRLPEDLVSEHVRRLAIFAVVGAALWGYGFLQDAVLLPATPRPPAWAKMHVPVEIFGIVMSAAMFVYVRYAAHSAQTKIHVGLGYMILSTALVAYFNTWVSSATEAQINQLSWNTLAILVSSMILPVPPRRMLAASLVAASTDPLGVWLAHLSGMPVPSVTQTLLLYLPNYVCAAIAMLPSSVLHGLGRRLREAQALGSYRLVELLGHGGMGEVWRAEHLLLARSVAIKLVRPEVLGAATPEEARLVLQRFQREARATAALSSPHTIQLFDYGMTDEGTFYYAMELLAGRDLETLVREFGPLPADRVIFLLRQVCHSLADAHARGLVHRDIKPANIYVCRMGQEYDFVKVLDFGLVKFKDTRNAPLTVRGYGQTTGTPAYMAPEIALGERDVDRRADVYALGCVAYYLLTGQLVFEADTSMKMLLHHVQDKPVPPSSRTELRIPRELDDLVLSCLEKDPNKRPQNAEVLYEIACRATTCASWDRAAARNWWTTHLADLTGPLTIDLGKDTQEILESAGPNGQSGPNLAAGASAWPNPRT